MSEVVERGAAALVKALEGQSGCAQTQEFADGRIEIDGVFDVNAAVRVVIEALRDHPSEAMREACHAYLIGNGPPYDLEDGTELRKDCDRMVRDILGAALHD